MAVAYRTVLVRNCTAEFLFFCSCLRNQIWNLSYALRIRLRDLLALQLTLSRAFRIINRFYLRRLAVTDSQ